VFSDYLTFETATNWGKAIVGRWDSMYLWNRVKVKAQVMHGALTVAVFGGIDHDGRLRLAQTKVNFDEFALKPITATTTPIECPHSFCAIGRIEIVGEFTDQTTGRAKQEMIQWGQQEWPTEDIELHKTIRLVDLTIAYDTSGEVGGQLMQWNCNATAASAGLLEKTTAQKTRQKPSNRLLAQYPVSIAVRLSSQEW